MAKTCNDARLWASMSTELRDWELSATESAFLARKFVAMVRRERATDGERTWTWVEAIPANVQSVYDVDGAVWDRVSTGRVPDSDRWKMQGFNDEEHDPRCGELHSTTELLSEWGPVTEVSRG